MSEPTITFTRDDVAALRVWTDTVVGIDDVPASRILDIAARIEALLSEAQPPQRAAEAALTAICDELSGHEDPATPADAVQRIRHLIGLRVKAEGERDAARGDARRVRRFYVNSDNAAVKILAAERDAARFFAAGWRRAAWIANDALRDTHNELRVAERERDARLAERDAALAKLDDALSSGRLDAERSEA